MNNADRAFRVQSQRYDEAAATLATLNAMEVTNDPAGARRHAAREMLESLKAMYSITLTQPVVVKQQKPRCKHPHAIAQASSGGTTVRICRDCRRVDVRVARS